ncbi:MAG TPA: transglutaminase domain-containing protein [Phycisphaerales bacterium]
MRRVLSACAVVAGGMTAWAQQASQPTGNSPGQNAQQASNPGPAPARVRPDYPKVTEGPYIERTLPKEWVLKITLDLLSEQGNAGTVPTNQSRQPFQFEQMVMVWPFVGSAANSVLKPDRVRSWLRFNAHDVITGGFAKETTPDNPRPMLFKKMASEDLYPAGVHLGTWTWEKPVTVQTVQLQIDIPSTSWRTRLNDAEALKVGWPKGPWPEEASACFQPEMYVDYGVDPRTGEVRMYDRKVIVDAVKNWTKGNPQEISPLRLAKFLAFQVNSTMSVTKQGFNLSPRTHFMEGLDMQGAPGALKSGIGSMIDIGTVLVAVMREAGLPARLVYAFQGEQHSRDGLYLRTWTQEERLRTWVEFCLYDEAKKTVNWVPIDYALLRSTSSRMQNLEQPWRYVGSIDYIGDLIPIAFQAFPPTTVVSYGSPGFWGWTIKPGVPAIAYQSIAISASPDQISPGDGSPSDTAQRPKR